MDRVTHVELTLVKDKVIFALPNVCVCVCIYI